MHIFVVVEKHLLLCTNDYTTIIKYGSSCHFFIQMDSITIQTEIQFNIEQLDEIVVFLGGGHREGDMRGRGHEGGGDMIYVT